MGLWYLNNAAHPQTGPARATPREARGPRHEPRRWPWNHRPGDLSIDLETGGVVAKLFLNTYTPFGGGTRSYLVPAVVDRLDPILDVLRPLMPGGPKTFIALCTMKALGVAPRARHADFLLAAA